MKTVNKKALYAGLAAAALATVGTLGNNNEQAKAATVATGEVEYFPGYGINLWNGYGSSASYAGRKLADGTNWKIFYAVKDTKGHVWYNLGGNQFADASYFKVIGSVPYKQDGTKPVTSNETSVKKTVTIKYVPGYGINLWNGYGSTASYAGRKLPHNSSWKVFKEANANDGWVWYKVGGNQWISSQYTNSPKRVGGTSTSTSGSGSTTGTTTSTTKPATNGTSSNTNNGSNTTPTKTAEKFDASVVRNTFYQLINEYRASKGLKPYITGNSLVNTWANTRVNELLTNYDHVRPNGQSTLNASTWEDFGFVDGFMGGGENLVAMPFKGMTNAQTAKELLKAWQIDFGHNSVLTDKIPGYMALGVKDVNGETVAAFELVQTDFTAHGSMPGVDPNKMKAAWEK